MIKVCKACGVAKTIDHFHKDRQKKDGLNHYCKPCHIARQREYDKRPPRFKAPADMKRCCRCKEVKPLSEFFKSSREFDGHERGCKPCRIQDRLAWAKKHPEKAAALARKWRAENPERSRDLQRKSLYGIEPGTYDAMLKAQEGRCAICRTTDPRGRSRSFHVDHCHDTNIVRGLLCHGCNVSIGHFQHDPSILQAAIAYLKKTQPKDDV